MADPLRRTLLAKLRGKKAKKGATIGGGYGSAAAVAAATEGREGKEKVSQMLQQQCDSGETRPAVTRTGMDCTAGRMSTYENCDDGPVTVRVSGGEVELELRECRSAQSAGTRTQEPCGGGRVRVNEDPPGVSLQRVAQYTEGEPTHRGNRSCSQKIASSAALHGPRVSGKHFVSVTRQRSAGDSIGFGDNSNHPVFRTHTGETASGRVVSTSDRDMTEPGVRGHSRHMAVKGHNANWSFDNRAVDPASSSNPHSAFRNSEENVLIRNVESYRPGSDEETRGTVGMLQSPTFFPTQLEICDIHKATAEDSLRYTLDSEDDDYYDNEILPFYETVRLKSDRADAAQVPRSDQERGDEGNMAQETDRLRNQLKEAYYLLINAMNDINLDLQQISGGMSEQQAVSSCSSRSRDSLCSRLSGRNMDSDSWSSGGDRSPQQVSDSDSLLLCLSRSHGPDFKCLKSKSTEALRSFEKGPVLLRSASDGAIEYLGETLLSVEVPTEQGPSRAGESKDSPGQLHDATHFDEGHGIGELDESSGSVDSFTCSSDGNADGPPHSQSQDEEREPAEVRAERSDSVSKGHGVTVNKMQEWMHKGRLLSTEMKQRIEGSPSPRAGAQCPDPSPPPATPLGCKTPVQTNSRGVRCVKAKCPTVKSPQRLKPAFLENVQTANGWEVGRTVESSTWRPHPTTITVSKKRNWLQQSTLGRTQCTKDELQVTPGAEEEGAPQPPPSPSPSPDAIRLQEGVPSRLPRLHQPQANISQMCAQLRNMDPGEENDADDEGEIWYNPIPEDEEQEISRLPSIKLLAAPGAEPQRRPSRAWEASHSASRSPGRCANTGLEVPRDGPCGSPGDGGQGSAVLLSEALLLHRRILASRTLDEGGSSTIRATDVPDLPNAVSSPPSSPNPAKKTSSINWSFPDKIKSPRTVRKISMKMKKLPELSRKLSVKGTPSSSGSNHNGATHLEPRAYSPKNGGGPEVVAQSSNPAGLASSGTGQASRNVISRYHLDSSVSTQHSFSKKKANGSSKSASKGGYLSDGDSPELVAKSGKHGSSEGKGGKGKEADGGVASSKVNGAELDIDAFRHYSFTEQPKCSQYISGLMSLHFYGAEDLKPPRIDSRDVYCAIQVDSVNKARTALLTCRTTFLDMDHTFNIELENAQHLKLVVFSWEPTPRRNRVCCHGTVVLPALFRVTRCHQLAVKLEPRGLIYVKLSLMEQWQNSLDGRPDGDREPQVFGVEAWRVVERESTGHLVPLLISKCINEIEKRGCQVVGLYRLCGSAAVKKELREAFERDSHGVELCENTYPDVNVITGVLKDYLRELPYPLITKQLYEAVLESMATRPLRMGASGCENEQADSEHTVSLLDSLPEVEKATLRRLLDHLKLVASHQEVNKMTCQNLAVCFGPVLLSQRQDASCHSNRVFIDSEELASALHFKKHIEVLHYLLQLWPIVDPNGSQSASLAPPSAEAPSAPPLRRRKERPQVLNLTDEEAAGVLRPRPGRLDSPSNRYAGDWSQCGDSYFPPEAPPPQQPSKEEADYDDVPSEEAEEEEKAREEEEEVVTEEEEEEDDEEEEEEEEEEEDEGDRKEKETMCEHILPPRLPKERSYQAYVKIQDISPVLSSRVNLRDLQESIDTLIGNLERELNKNKLNVGY